MAEKNYKTVSGFVQFEPEERKANNQTVRSVVLRQQGSEGPLVTATIWPEYAEVDIQRGDFVAIDGDLQVRVGQNAEGEKREYLNISASKLVVIPSEKAAAREVVNRKKTKGKF